MNSSLLFKLGVDSRLLILLGEFTKIPDERRPKINILGLGTIEGVSS
jgi:hypothetical protein